MMNALGPPLKPHWFFATHPFFRLDEFVAAYAAEGHSRSAAIKALEYYASIGVLTNVRRGIYFVDSGPFDALLLPSKVHPQAILAFDGAAAFHQLTCVENSLTYLAPVPIPRFVFSEVIFRCVADPDRTDVLSLPAPTLHEGHSVLVTCVEHTIVDCLDRLDLGPDMEDLFDGVYEKHDLPLNLDTLVEYAIRRANPIGAARVGLLLSSHPRHRSSRTHITALQKAAPKRTTYATRDRERGGQYFRRWKLVVPHDFAKRLVNDA